MSGTISGVQGHGIDLANSTYANPVTVSGTIQVAYGSALGSSTRPWSIVNQGTINAPGSVDVTAYVPHTVPVYYSYGGLFGYGYTSSQTYYQPVNVSRTQSSGINMQAGGNVTNAHGAIITGYFNGVLIDGGPGYVLNQGTINGWGAHGAGIDLERGGRVVNLAGGTIFGGADGVYVNGGGAAIYNAGSIGGGHRGIFLGQGGGVINAGMISAGGADASGVSIRGGSGYVDNLQGGVITAPYNGVSFGDRSGYVLNQGVIDGGGSLGAGVDLQAGGNIINTGTIIGGADAGYVMNGFGVVQNQGSMAGGHRGVYLGQGGLLINDGTLIGTGTAGTAGTGAGIGAGGMVANTGGAFLAGYSAALSIAGAGLISNAGTIDGTGTAAIGITLVAGGAIANAAGGRIAGAGGGVLASGAPLTLANSGTILGGHGYGVSSAVGGTIVNNAGGGIYGHSGVDLGAAGTVVNQAIIGASGGPGVDLGNGGLVHNNALIFGGSYGVVLGGNGAAGLINTGTITGAIGVGGGGAAAGQSQTIVNAGTIAGTAGTAITFGGGTDSLIVDPGAVFQGQVRGGAGTDTLNLAGGNGGAGTLTGIGTQFVNFATIAFNPSTDWQVAGNAAGLAAGQAITGFSLPDTLDLTGFAASSDSFASNALTLSHGTSTETLDIQGNYTTPNFHIASDGSGGTDITLVPCFLEGTLIATERGAVAVEALVIGDRVLTASGGSRPIKWLGRRSYAGAFAARNRAVWPVRIAAGALGGGIPGRDVHLSPNHAIYLDGVLVPAGKLVNGRSIVLCRGVDPIRYVHVELDAHDVLLAEGMPAESFMDRNSRALFHNAADFAVRYPDDTGKVALCAPLVEGGRRLVAIRRRLAAGLFAPPGRLEGNLDRIGRTALAGWARDAANPGLPVRLELLLDGRRAAELLADAHRADLEAAGIGEGSHGFSHEFPRPLDPRVAHEVRLRRLADQAELPGSPARIAPSAAFDDDARAVIEATLGAAAETADAATLAAMTGFLFEQANTLLAARARLPAPAARPARRQALVIDERLPTPGRDGGSNAIISHIQALRALGYAVRLIAAGEIAAPGLELPGVEILAAPWYASVEEALRRHGPGLDLVYLHRAPVALAYAGLARRHAPGARILYSLADLHHLRLARQAAIEARPELAREAAATRDREFLAMRLADAVITHSAAEAAYITREAPGAAVHVVAFTPGVTPIRRAFAERRGVVFVGGASHAPNADAVRFLLDTIMPRVWASDPDIPCLIAGEGWDASLARGRKQVRLLGRVADLSAVFGAVRLSVAPLRFGAGLKGKLLDSLAAFVPCIGTAIAWEGLAAPDACRADDAAGFAAAILRLHADRRAHAAAARAGMAPIRKDFSPAAIRRALARALAPVVKAAPGRRAG